MPVIYCPAGRILSHHGKTAVLTQKSAECLNLLLVRKGQTVSKEEIMEECWARKGVIVTDVSVRQTLYHLRQALNSVDAHKNTLVTEPKSGYRLDPAHILQHEAAAFSEEVPVSESDPAKVLPAGLPSVASRLLVIRSKWGVVALLFFVTLPVIAALRLSLLVHPVDYYQVLKTERYTFLAQSGVTDDPQVILTKLDIFADANYVALPAHAWVYINRTYQPHQQAWLVCDRPLETAEHTCFAMHVQGE